MSRAQFDAMVAGWSDLDVLQAIDFLDETPTAVDRDAKRARLLAEAQRRLGPWLTVDESPDDVTALNWANCRKVLFGEVQVG